MDALTWIHANERMEELRILPLMDGADMQVDVSTKSALIDNTWSITVPESVWEQNPIRQGHYIYSPGTEWGGPVTVINHNTGAKQITLQGPTWRGQMYQKFISPNAGEDYLVFTNIDANELVRRVLGSVFGSLYTVTDEAAGVLVSASYRYQTMAQGLQNTLRGYGMRLDVVFDNVSGHVILSAAPTDTLTEEIEISQDYGVDFSTSIGNIEFANHCLALGSGELAQRMVANVYRTENGYSTTRPAAMTDAEIRTVKLEYPNAESLEELVKSAIETLEGKAPAQAVKVNALTIGLDAHLGDVLAVRDRVTGLAAQAEIVNKILTVTDGRMKIDMMVDTISTNLDE